MRTPRPIALASFVLFAATPLGAASAQEAAAGQQVFAQCQICHQIGPGAQNFIGPDLNGVVGRKAGTEPGYDYSDALKKSGLAWNKATLTKWLTDPSKLVPGTKMTFPGLSNAKDTENVIAYLSQFGPNGQKK